MSTSLLVLMIDDDGDDQEFFSMVMEESFPSIKYVFANDGVHALEKLNRDLSLIPQIIFIDINMPRMNGMECLVELKKIPRLQQSHIYMYSTSIDPMMIKRCSDLGACGFIKKEATTEALQQRLSEVISQLKLPSL